MSQIQVLNAQSIVAHNTVGEVTKPNNKEVYMKIVGAYKNGNYRVTIFDNGTKIRETEDEFIPDRLESVDMKITNKCDVGCPFCHEKSTPNGEHADLNNPVINTFLPYTEIAIGGGNPLCHPQLESFLIHLKELKCFPSITVNQKHFIEEYDRITRLYNENLFYGLGVSVTNLTKEFADKNIELIIRIATVISSWVCARYNVMRKKEDYIQDTILYIIQNTGSEEKNFADNEKIFTKIVYKKAIKYNREFAYGYYNLACAYIKTGDLKRAKTNLVKAIELNNMEPDFHYNLAYVYKKLGKTKMAEIYLQNYNKLTNGI